VLAFTVLLVGCSIKFVYNQLDWLIPWYLDDYVTINTNQAELLDERLNQYLYWHRREQLPLYAGFLDDIADAAQDNLTQQEMDQVFNRARDFLDDLLAELANPLADLMLLMDDQQVAELVSNLEERNQRYRQRFIETSEKAQRERRSENMQKIVKRWVAELNEQQVELIELWANSYHLLGEEFLQSRQKWQGELQALLQRDDRPGLARDQLVQLLANRPRPDGGEARRKYYANIELLKRLYLDLDRTLSSYQRSQLVRGLSSYADDFRELAATG
jgi:arsenate reductase-like glutaredoxin family protein